MVVGVSWRPCGWFLPVGWPRGGRCAPHQLQQVTGCVYAVIRRSVWKVEHPLSRAARSPAGAGRAGNPAPPARIPRAGYRSAASTCPARPAGRPSPAAQPGAAGSAAAARRRPRTARSRPPAPPPAPRPGRAIGQDRGAVPRGSLGNLEHGHRAAAAGRLGQRCGGARRGRQGFQPGHACAASTLASWSWGSPLLRPPPGTPRDAAARHRHSTTAAVDPRPRRCGTGTGEPHPGQVMPAIIGHCQDGVSAGHRRRSPAKFGMDDLPGGPPKRVLPARGRAAAGTAGGQSPGEGFPSLPLGTGGRRGTALCRAVPRRARPFLASCAAARGRQPWRGWAARLAG